MRTMQKYIDAIGSTIPPFEKQISTERFTDLGKLNFPMVVWL